MKYLRNLLLFCAAAGLAWGTAGDIEIAERTSTNQRVNNILPDPAGDGILMVDDSNAAGAKVEVVAIGAGLAFDGTTLSATAGGNALTDLAAGTTLAVNTDYFDTFSGNRTLTVPAGTDGDTISLVFDATTSVEISFSLGVYRLGETSTTTGPLTFPTGNHKLSLEKKDAKWTLIDTAVDSETANTFLAAPDGAPGAMTPRAIVDGDIPAAIARDSELPTRATLGLDTTDKPTFANVVVTHSTHTYAATITVDFTGDGFKTLTFTGDPTFATSNRAAGRSVTYRLDPAPPPARPPGPPVGIGWAPPRPPPSPPTKRAS